MDEPVRRRPWLQGTADALVAGFGCWGVYAWIMVYTGQTFRTLANLAWLPLFVSLALTAWLVLRQHEGPLVATPSLPPGRAPELTLAWAAVACVAVGFGAPVLVAWAFGLVHLVALGSAWGPGEGPLFARATGRDLVSVGLTGLLGMLVVLGVNKPDVDDAYYLNAIMSALRYPDLAVLSFDGLHGDTSAPIQQVIHRPQTYELFVATVARWLPIGPLSVYYITLPALFALALPVAQWRLAKAWTGRLAWLVVPVLLLLLVSWGHDHRTFGNYSFVRLFQGKGIFLFVLLPLVLHAAMVWSQRPSLSAWVRLCLAQCAAAVFTSTALVVVPIAAGLALLAGVVPAWRSLWRSGVGLAASLPVVGILLVVRHELALAGNLVSEGDDYGMEAVTGPGIRQGLTLLGVVAAPYLARTAGLSNAAWIGRLVAVTWVLVFNGVMSGWLAKGAALLSWRLYWASPVPLLLALSVASGAALVPRGVARRGGRALAGGAVLGGLLFVASDGWTTARSAQVMWDFAGSKRPPRFRIARQVADLTEPDDLVLAAEPIALWMTSFRDGPRLVAVRKFYTDNLSRYWGWPESERRWDLMRWVDGRPVDLTLGEVMVELDTRCVDVVVTGTPFERQPHRGRALQQHGFVSQPSGSFFIWTRTDHAACTPSPHP